MAETTRSNLHVQPQAASTTMNGAASHSGHSIPGTSTPPTPQMSPTQGKTGRRLHTKVLEELKNVTSRKSPAINTSAVNATAATAIIQVPLLSPLNLNGDHGFDSGGADGSSPRIPAPANGANGKAKNCGLCERSFTVFRAKHTCKVCNMKICDDCSKNRAKLNRRLERRKGSRLCDACARDYMQLATPMMSPSDARHENRRSSVESDTPFELGGRSPENTSSSTAPTNPAANQLQRAASIVKQTILSSTDSAASSSSYLRPRHWLSLCGVAFLLMARWFRFQTVSRHGGFIVRDDEDPGQELLLEAHGIALLFLSLTNWIDRFASIRVLAAYLLGLVAYDEYMARSQRQALRPAASLRASASLAARKRLRSRTRSTMSESLTSSTTQPSIPSVVRERDDDEVLEVEVGDKPLDDGVGFNYDKLVASLVDCASKNRASDNTMKMSAFLVACDFMCGLTSAFGRATSFAGSTVSGYINTITTNLAGWPIPASAANSTTFSWREESVRTIVLREIEMKTASAGGKKKPSCARCVLRLIWFIEFVEAVVRYTMIENKEESCAAGASKAYEETIGVRHPWIIRKGVNSALGALPTRSAILESLHLNELSPEEVLVQLHQAQSTMRTMLTELNALLKEHNLLDIK